MAGPGAGQARLVIEVGSYGGRVARFPVSYRIGKMPPNARTLLGILDPLVRDLRASLERVEARENRNAADAMPGADGE